MSSLHQFPVVESCDKCGACCRVQGAPPDYVALSLNPRFKDDPSFADDVVRFESLSGDPMRLLKNYLEESTNGKIPTDGPCVWLDEEREKCRFYELRPSTCRVFELNGPGCFYYRKQAGLVEPGS